MDTVQLIKDQIENNKVILYMKGTPEQPKCGFSMRAVQALQACEVPFAHVDVLAYPEIRQTLPLVSHWPTFPQLFIKGELIGGSDIVWAHYESGDLKNMLQEAVNS